jgi:hypothetical protein
VIKNYVVFFFGSEYSIAVRNIFSPTSKRFVGVLCLYCLIIVGRQLKVNSLHNMYNTNLTWTQGRTEIDLLYHNTILGHAIPQWLRYYATSRKVADTRPDEVNELFSIYLILPVTLGRGVYSASNRKKYQKQKNVSGE